MPAASPALLQLQPEGDDLPRGAFSRLLNGKHHWLAPLLVSLAVTALYVRDANPAVGGGNSGEFQVMAHLLGIAHPPSYPLYLLLAKAASLVPAGGDVAWRINVFTALLGGGAVLLTGLLPCSLGIRGARGALAGMLAAVATGAMPRLWTLAVEAEVFTLHLLLVVALWHCLARWRDVSASGRGDRWLLAAAALVGLGLANHRTYLFSAGAAALYVVAQHPGVLRRGRLIAGSAALAAVGLSPYLYVLRGFVFPVPYFAPLDVHRLSRGEVWYVVQGNAAGETGGGEVIARLFADPVLLDQRARWLVSHVTGQFGVFGAPLTVLGVIGFILLARRAACWVLCALLGSAASAVFAMSYAKYPDADRYLLPLEALLALGLAFAVSGALDRATLMLGGAREAGATRRLTGRALGALCGLALGGYWAFSLGVLAGSTDFTRGGYVHHTLHNLNAVERDAVVCSWWASSWGWWYAQHVDGVRQDVRLVPKSPDDCLKDVLPSEFERRRVYLPALTERMRASEYVFFPSRDLWLAVGRRAPLRAGDLLKGPDERIFFYDGVQRSWVPSIEHFTARGFSWDLVQLTPEYVLRDIPEGPALQ